MSLKFILFNVIIVIPVLVLSYFLYSVDSLFTKKTIESSNENQIQLLNTIHLYLGKGAEADLAEKMKSVYQVPGLQNLLVSDKTGIVRYAINPTNIGRSLSELYSPQVVPILQEAQTQQGNLEIKNKKHDLLSYLKADIGDDRMVLTMSLAKKTAARISTTFFFKLVAVLAALFFIFIAVSQIVTMSYSHHINVLSRTLKKLGLGQAAPALKEPRSGDFKNLYHHVERFRQKMSPVETQSDSNSSEKKSEFTTVLPTPTERQNQGVEIDFYGFNRHWQDYLLFENSQESEITEILIFQSSFEASAQSALLAGMLASQWKVAHRPMTLAERWDFINREWANLSPLKLEGRCCLFVLDEKTGELTWLRKGLPTLKGGTSAGETIKLDEFSGSLKLAQGSVVWWSSEKEPQREIKLNFKASALEIKKSLIETDPAAAKHSALVLKWKG